MSIHGVTLALLLVLAAASVVLTGAVRHVAVRTGAVAPVRTDGLDIHARPVPRVGGVAFGIAFLAGMSVVFIGGLYEEFHRALSATHSPPPPFIGAFVGFFEAAVIILGVGVADDIWGISPRLKTFGQLAAACAFIIGGIRFNLVPVIWIAVPLTVFLVLGSINTFNFLDGQDGLAAGYTAIVAVGYAFLLYHVGRYGSVLVTLLFASVLVGFLVHNRPPASIFMGDCGSGLIGICVAVMVARYVQPYRLDHFLVVAITLSVPMCDTLMAIVRRRIWRRSVSSGDRWHIYDILARRFGRNGNGNGNGNGSATAKATLVMYGIAAVTVGLGVWADSVGPMAVYAVAALVAAGLVAMIFGFDWLRLRTKRAVLAFGRPGASAQLASGGAPDGK